jgi:hypothetical protein
MPISPNSKRSRFSSGCTGIWRGNYLIFELQLPQALEILSEHQTGELPRMNSIGRAMTLSPSLRISLPQ